MLNDAGPRGFPVSVVDGGIALKVRHIQKFGFKTDAAVLQRAEAEPVEGVDRPGVKNLFRQRVQRFAVFQIIAVQADLNAVQHILHQCGVASDRDALIQGVEVVVVEGQPNRKPPDDKGGQLFAVAAPLFFGIAFDQLLKDVPANQRDGLFFQIFRLSGDFLPLFGYFCGSFLRRDDPPHFVEGVHVEGQTVEFAPVVCHRGVGKAVEHRKAVHIVPDLFAAGVKDVRAVDVYLDAFDRLRIDVAADVRTFVDHEDAFSGCLRLVREYRTVEAGADDQIIILGHGYSPFMEKQR